MFMFVVIIDIKSARCVSNVAWKVVRKITWFPFPTTFKNGTPVCRTVPWRRPRPAPQPTRGSMGVSWTPL